MFTEIFIPFDVPIRFEIFSMNRLSIHLIRKMEIKYFLLDFGLWLDVVFAVGLWTTVLCLTWISCLDEVVGPLTNHTVSKVGILMKLDQSIELLTKGCYARAVVKLTRISPAVKN